MGVPQIKELHELRNESLEALFQTWKRRGKERGNVVKLLEMCR